MELSSIQVCPPWAGVDSPELSRWPPRRHDGLSHFHLGSLSLVREPYTCWTRGRTTHHREVLTHVWFPLVPGPDPRRGKGVVRIAKLLPGTGSPAGELPAPFSAFFYLGFHPPDCCFWGVGTPEALGLNPHFPQSRNQGSSLQGSIPGAGMGRDSSLSRRYSVQYI